MPAQQNHFKLHPAQATVHNSKARFKVVAAGRRFGKSHYAAIRCIAEVLKSEHTGRSGKVYKLTPEHPVMYVAPFFKQAKDIFEEKIKVMGGWGTEDSLITSYNATEGNVKFVNGRTLRLRGADNADSLRGNGFSFVVLDEYADMEGSEWNTIIRPAMMDVEGEALFIGTPKGRNHFYNLFNRGLAEMAESDEPEWASFSYASSDNPGIQRSELRDSEDDLKDERTVRQEMHAEFIDEGSGDLDPDKLILDPYEPEDGYFVVTADLAGFESAGAKRTKEKRDNSAICVVKVHPKGWWVKDIKYGRWTVSETCALLARAVQTSGSIHVGIEKGISRQVVDNFWDEYCRKYLGRYIPIHDLTHGNQKKESRLEWALSPRLRRGEIQLAASGWSEYPWVMKLREEMKDFPGLRSQDDVIDALAYVEQMPQQAMQPLSYEDYLDPLDEAIGY